MAIAKKLIIQLIIKKLNIPCSLKVDRPLFFVTSGVGRYVFILDLIIDCYQNFREECFSIFSNIKDK